MISKSTIVVRYAETDQMGIVHHSVYPVWYEVARTDFVKKLGLTYTDMEKTGVMTPLVDLKCKYIGAAYYEDELTVEVRIKELTPVKIEFEYSIFKKGVDKPINIGSTIHAWVGKNFRPMNMKKHHKELYELIQSALE